MNLITRVLGNGPLSRVGEKRSGTITSGNNIMGVIGSAANITLPTGNWLVFKKLHQGNSGQDGTTNLLFSAELVLGSSSTLPVGETYETFPYPNFSLSQSSGRFGMMTSYISVVGSATYYLNARATVGGALSTATTGGETILYAIRIS